MKQEYNVLNVEAKVIGKMEQDQQATEECNDIIVETVAIGFPNGSLLYQILPLFSRVKF